MVRCTFSPARAWRPAAGAPLARTLGLRTAACGDPHSSTLLHHSGDDTLATWVLHSTAPHPNDMTMWRVYALIGIIWLVLMPPLFTAGACTDEFNDATNRLMRDGAQLRTPESATEYFRSNGAPVSAITPERCKESKPRFMSRCGSGTVVYAKVPVKNQVCRLYRDEDVKVYIEYDDRGRVLRFNTDMAAYKSLPVPGTKTLVHWGR